MDTQRFVHITKITISRNNLEVVITGNVRAPVKDNKLYFIAAAPADRRSSYTGSGLPFKDEEQAFDSTPNIGLVETDVVTGHFVVKVMHPNSYITNAGTEFIHPTVFLKFKTQNGVDNTIPVQVSRGIPYRSLDYPPNRKDATFYDNIYNLPVRTQEQVLLDSAYVSDVNYDTYESVASFWRGKPAT